MPLSPVSSPSIMTEYCNESTGNILGISNQTPTTECISATASCFECLPEPQSDGSTDYYSDKDTHYIVPETEEESSEEEIINNDNFLLVYNDSCQKSRKRKRNGNVINEK